MGRERIVPPDVWAALADPFGEAYASVKGQVRTYVLHAQLLRHLPPPPAGVLRRRRRGSPIVAAGPTGLRRHRPGSVAGHARQSRAAARCGAGRGPTACPAGRGARRAGSRGDRRGAVRGGALPRRADVPRAAGAAGFRAVPLRGTRGSRLDHGAQRPLRWPSAPPSSTAGPTPWPPSTPPARSGCSAPTPGATPSRTCRCCCGRAAWTPRSGTASGCSRTGWSLPPDSTDVTAVAEVELQASVRDPYRQLSRVFHLIGRAQAPGQLAAGR